MPAVAPAGKAKASPAQGGKCRPQAGALPAGAPASGANRGGCPGLCRFPARFSPCVLLGVLSVVLFAVAARVSASRSGSLLWLWGVPASASGCVLPGGVGVPAFGFSASRSGRALFASAAQARAAFSAAGGFFALPGSSSSAVRARARVRVVRVSVPSGACVSGLRAAGFGVCFPCSGWRSLLPWLAG